MASASTSTATPEPDKSAPSATTTAATTADDLLLEDNITNDTAPAELTAVVDSLLESLTHKFSSVSHEIFTKTDTNTHPVVMMVVSPNVILPTEEQTTRWARAISRRVVSPDRLWLLVRSIVGPTLDRWPDSLHAPELDETETTLRGWFHPRLLHRPLWRTAICTPAGEAWVKRSCVAVYVITYQQTAVPGGTQPRTRRQKG
ncbi:MAG: hypothetical protein M1823_000355 [Watsoniomyces obsoletus]|nr:MAG: hypothetical protein M1823_000355 [Watsoniomyces obsoletus]